MVVETSMPTVEISFLVVHIRMHDWTILYYSSIYAKWLVSDYVHRTHLEFRHRSLSVSSTFLVLAIAILGLLFLLCSFIASLVADHRGNRHWARCLFRRQDRGGTTSKRLNPC